MLLELYDFIRTFKDIGGHKRTFKDIALRRCVIFASWFQIISLFAIINKRGARYFNKKPYICSITETFGNMKTRIFLLALLWTLALTLQAQSYDQLWKKVNQLANDDLPQSAIVEAQRIYDKAKAERNVPQMMKAHLMVITFRGHISPDSIPVDVKGLEEWAESPELEAHEKAVLYSILGGVHIYDDFEKGDRFLKLSLQDSLTLINYPAGKMVPMVRSMETSRMYMEDNLLDLLARRAIEYWKKYQWHNFNEVQVTISQTYQMLARQYERIGNRAAWVLTILDAYPGASEEQLREWIAEYGDLEVCAEIYLRLSQNTQLKRAERVSLLREAIQRYPNYIRIHLLKKEEQDLTSPSLEISMNAYPDEEVELAVNYRVLKGVTLKFYRLDLPVHDEGLQVPSDQLKKQGKLYSQEHIDLPPTPDFEAKKIQVRVKPLPAGLYYWEAVPDGYKKQTKGEVLHVTALGLVFQNLYNTSLRFVTVDRKSGHVIPNVEIVRYAEVPHRNKRYTVMQKAESYTTNQQGTLLLPKQEGWFQARLKNDSAMNPVGIWDTRPYRVEVKPQRHIRLLTDRSIYRPGQKVHYSGLVYEQLKDSVWLVKGVNYKVNLKDADRKEVASQEWVTDEFGTFHGTFDLPNSGKLGAYLLEVDKVIQSFRVEEYKRPTFEVTMDTVRATYQAGDSIRIKGRAYTFAGVPVQGATVNYQIQKRERDIWRGGGRSLGTENGQTQTDAQGVFEVPVYFAEMKSDVPVMDYVMTADVTSLSGETHQGNVTLPLGQSSLLVTLSDWKYHQPQTILKEDWKPLMFKVTNLQGFPATAEVEYRVYRETDEKTLGDCVLQAKAKSNQSFVPEDLYALPSGAYRLKFAVCDEKGRKNENEASVVLFSNRDKRIPCKEPLWIYQRHTQFNEKGDAVFYLGTCEKDVTLIIDSYSGHKSLGTRFHSISDTLWTVRCKYKEEWGNGYKVVLSLVKNGKLHSQTIEIKKPEPNRQLEFQWKTFRDKLQPGSQEQWTLKILRPDGTPADARLMATMYDASLDAFSANNWYFRLYYDRTLMGTYWALRPQGHSAQYFNFPRKRVEYTLFKYSGLFEPYEWPVVTVGYGGKMSRKSAPLAFTGAAQFNGSLDQTVLFEEEMVPIAENFVYTLEESSVVGGKRPEVKIRENFAETAFFYPQLRTDANGEVNIDFTLPESLTTWKFMGLAHTQDLFHGNITEEVVVSKPFMLQLQMPRFVRVGDQVSVVATLMNQSDKEVKGKVRMELFVPETEQVILSKVQSFEVKMAETGKVAFSFDVSDKYEGLGVRMVADGGTFSDGEQRYLPVLSNKQQLTESVLLNVNGAGDYTFSLESLFNGHSKTVSRPKMTVEFTGNPLWYAVQALKVVGNPDNDNALSWAVAYYANSLTDYLSRTQPALADSLKVEGIQGKMAEAVRKLKYLQTADGSWAWFKGMSGSRYMTTRMVELLARLQQMTGEQPDADVQEMYQKAVGYLAEEVAEEVKRMKKMGEEKYEMLPSEDALTYLYVATLDPKVKVSSDVKTYLIKRLADSSRLLTIYGKALGANILHSFGLEAKAKEFLESVMQYSVMTEEMGRYFDTPKAEYSWFSYRIPTQVAVIEAIHSLTKEVKTVEEMKRWLLKQKQAQAWDTPIATADAVYALLMTGEDWSQHTGVAEIKVGKQVIRTPENALGYVRQEVDGNVMDIRKVTVKKESAGIAWGAVYAEFEENLDQVSAQGHALEISRTLCRDGQSLPVGASLKVGDKLTVRLTLKADRDMDFVQVKDNRAAFMEPVDALSGYGWNQTLAFYRENKDASTSFFVERLRKGTHVLEYEVYVTSSGQYTQGIPTVQSVYAPEFVGHGESGKWIVNNNSKCY